MNLQTVALGNCRFEILTAGEELCGIGKVYIGETLVRSGRLPLRPYTQSFTGAELTSWRLLGVEASGDVVRVQAEASFRPLPVKLMRDHSFDPIHDQADWDAPQTAGSGRLDLVLSLAADAFNGVKFAGFSYHYEYRSDNVPLFYLLDMASWELDGDIVGASAYSQSSCSPPVAHFAPDTTWSTEGILHFLVEDNNQNPVMTHNLPRWASHGSFDFQYKGDRTLIGVFEHVDLIRSLLVRDAGKAELKTFDKHIFDETLSYDTSAKKILLNSGAKTVVGQQNLWTWIFTEVDDRARAEFGIQEELPVFSLGQNFWDNFTVDSYYIDLLPAAIAVGARRVFVDNLKKSSMTERAPMPGVFNWNMCCGHEYEISDKLGGVKRVQDFIGRAADANVQVMVWTNNDQALSSPLNSSERDDKGWFVLLEDARQKYGGAYNAVMSVLDLGVDGARDYFVQSHIAIREQTGLSALYFDSFYNLGFMPISYRGCKPRTMWRGLLQAFRELQQAGFNMAIESFGPFGQPGHGHPSTYNFENIFACIKVGVGNDYSTVPSDHPVFAGHRDDINADFFGLAHMANLISGSLYNKEGKRIDEVWTDEQKRIVAVYHDVLPLMKHRYMQEDGKSVIWHNTERTQATLWNFITRKVGLSGSVVDLTTGETLPQADGYTLQERHTYAISGCVLPTVVSEVVLAGAVG